MKKQRVQELSGYFAQYNTIRYKKGETIIHGGEDPAGVYYIKHGYARLVAISLEGKELTLMLYGPGDIFPMVWAFAETPTIYDFQAFSNVELARCPKDHFLALQIQQKSTVMSCMKDIIKRYDQSLLRLETMAFGTMYEKTLGLFEVLASQVGREVKNQIIIQVHLTHKDIASFLGTTRETASLQISKLKKAGILAQHGPVFIIKDTKKLKKARETLSLHTWKYL